MLLMAVAARCSLHVSASRPLQLKVTSSIKPEAHNVAQHCEKDQARATGDLHTKFCEDQSSGSRDMLMDGQTDRQMS